MKSISAVCHPLMMATYMSLLLLLFTPELFSIHQQALWYFLAAVFLTTALMPMLCILYLRYFSNISSLELTERRERPIPFSIITIWYIVSAYLFIEKLNLNKPFSTIFVSVTVLIAILFLITIWFKISIHSAAIWSSAGILTALVITQHVDISYLVYISIILAGITSCSRLYLGYHQPKEIWSGAILGFFFGFFTIYAFG